MLLLFALIFRGVSFAFRDAVASARWRCLWDVSMTLGSFLPALLLGVAFANIFQGIPIDAAGIYQGTLFTLLNPYGLAGGLLFVLLFLVHGAIWLAVKTETESDLHKRAAARARKTWPLLLGMAVIFLLATLRKTDLYDNYLAAPVLFLIPGVAVAGLIMMWFFMRQAKWWKAWFASCATIVGVTFFGVAGLYPRLLPSSLDPSHSLTIYNSASSSLTLTIMLVVTLIFVPIVIAYQVWVHFLFKDKITEADLSPEEAY